MQLNQVEDCIKLLSTSEGLFYRLKAVDRFERFKARSVTWLTQHHPPKLDLSDRLEN